MIMGVTREDLEKFDSFQVTGLMTGMFGPERDRLETELNSVVVASSRPLRLDSTGVIIVKVIAAAHYGQSFLDILYTTAEIREINAFKATRRRYEKLAGKLAAKILAYEAIRRWFGVRCPLQAIQVLSQSGPPGISVPGNTRLNAQLEKLYFSLSHSGDLVCAAVACHPVGIDVEKIQPLSEETVLEICEENIREAMANYRQRTQAAGLVPEALPIVVFTQKEAVLKAAGVGIIRGLAEVELLSFALGAMVDACCFGSKYKILSIDSDGYIFSLTQRIE
jgi:phosphopantetheinyl transferase (holo-ACP synthase)